MKNKWQIVLSGVGGQGLIACGNLIAEAAIMQENKYATLTSSHGVETRGTFSKSDVIISDNEIYYPEVMKADVVLSLAQVAYNRYVSAIGPEAYLVYDSSMVTDLKESKAKQIGFPFTEIAREMGNIAVANIVALGAIVKITGLLKEKSIVYAIESTFGEKPKVMELNMKAFNKGLELVEGI